MNWHRADEGLPPQPGRVLVAFPGGGMALVFFDGKRRRQWTSHPDGTGHSYITPVWWASVEHPEP